MHGARAAGGGRWDGWCAVIQPAVPCILFRSSCNVHLILALPVHRCFAHCASQLRKTRASLLRPLCIAASKHRSSKLQNYPPLLQIQVQPVEPHCRTADHDDRPCVTADDRAGEEGGAADDHEGGRLVAVAGGGGGGGRGGDGLLGVVLDADGRAVEGRAGGRGGDAGRDDGGGGLIRRETLSVRDARQREGGAGEESERGETTHVMPPEGGARTTGMSTIRGRGSVRIHWQRATSCR